MSCIRHARLFAAGMVAMLAAAGPAATACGAEPASYQEPLRPQFHFTPAQNWMNDPNGLVYDNGEYHLFFQHNPFGNDWGNMSWGHAVSRDLMHWEQLPVAIPATADEAVFSGSAVVDTANTSGFGTAASPPMVAIYTSARPGSQAQSLAYSTDHGRTWTKYAGNPILDIGSADFRDPKVFWYAPAKRWIMTVALSAERKVRFYYSSPDLKRWTHLSDFGPANAVTGVWECPDLFPLPVDGDPSRVKWVLLVNLSPGAVSGGSGAQYFVGRFDGTRFVSDDPATYVPPAGDVLQSFEGQDYGDWTATGTAFGSGPARGTLPGQQEVGGFAGSGLVNTFLDGDAPRGTLTSPSFTVGKPYINFLLGGGEHPHRDGDGDGVPPAGNVLADFEGDGWGAGWSADGALAGRGPAAGALAGQWPVSGYEGRRLVNTFVDGDGATGTISSPEFDLSTRYVDLLVGGGNHPWGGADPTAVNLVVDGEVVRTATGKDSERLDWVSWDVGDLQGRRAHLEIVDRNAGGWGHVLVDHVVLADAAVGPRGSAAAVELLVDGQVVRSATGRDSERLDWASWDVRDLVGRRARIRIVDAATDGWGHVLVDQITAADAPALSELQRARWVDYGKDFYGAVTYDGAPGGRRIAIGWMSNWQYAGSVPTDPWRGAMTVPRELVLRTFDGRPQLVQAPVAELDTLRDTGGYSAPRSVLPAGTSAVDAPGASGSVLDINARFVVRDAARFGLRVRVGDGQATTIGYDVARRELYVDRTGAGAGGFAPTFPGVQRAPVAPISGAVRLRVLVDRSSVEVFAQGGRRAITDLVFPDAGSRRIELFSEGGSTGLDQLDVRPLRSIWGTG